MGKTGFFKFFAIILEICGSGLGINMGPERPSISPILGVLLKSVLVFYSFMFKILSVEANLAKYKWVKLDFSSFSL